MWPRVVGRDLFTRKLSETLGQFEQAKNFGSLIVPKLGDPAEVEKVVRLKDFSGDLLLRELKERVLTVLRMANFLSQKYHVVVANPPYKMRSDLNRILASWLDVNYENSKSDLFSAFIERGQNLVLPRHYCAMVTMELWMFLDFFKKLRANIIDKATIISLIHMPYLGKGGTPMRISFGTSAFVLRTIQNLKYIAEYNYIRYFEIDENLVPLEFPTKNERLAHVSTEQLKAIPDYPIAYWASEKLRSVFTSHSLLRDEAPVKKGIDTGKNALFLRFWYEVSDNTRSKRNSNEKWFDYIKGGEYRKWYGNCDLNVNWERDGYEIRNHPSSTIRNSIFFFKPAITWSLIANKGFGARVVLKNCLFDNNGSSVFPEDHQIEALSCFLNSKVADYCLQVLNPTAAYQVGDIARLPYTVAIDTRGIGETLVLKTKADWDGSEISWDFASLPLLATEHRAVTLRETYGCLRTQWRAITQEMQRLEEENNRIFIDAYGLQDELGPEVRLEEVTLTCNPAYRYGGNRSDDELEDLLRADTMRDFLSYAVGCMFGRYSLDAPGLILANQNHGMAEYREKVPNSTFTVTEDNIIPVLERDWFEGDVTARFHEFLRATFGTAKVNESLAFIEEAIGKDVRKFFTRDFFADHLKRYKKRPIYWLFSSGSERAFQSLVYLHRYNEGTLARIRTEYVVPLQGRIFSRIAQIDNDIVKAASTSHARKLQKELDDLRRQGKELAVFEEKLRHMADQRIVLDLDDGVKVNYGKFGDLLAEVKTVTGGKDEE